MDKEELNKTNVDSLVGREFRRNKYGLSTWIDTITYVGYSRNLLDRSHSAINMYVIGTSSKIHYSIDEIVLVNKVPLHWSDQAQLQKREIHTSIRSGDFENVAKLIKSKNESN